jgi:hypothetical protein
MEKAVVLGKLKKNPCRGAKNKGFNNKPEVQIIELSDIPKFLKETYQ